MRKITMALMAALLCTGFNSSGQIKPDQLLAGSQQDINYLANGYLQPLGTALAEGLNNGWYSTAKTHNLGRFDLIATVSIVQIPEVDRTFLVENSELDQLQLVSGTSEESQTAFGNAGTGPALEYKIAPGTTINLPGGTGFSYVPVPMAKISVGLIKNTEVTFRYLPEMSIPKLDEAKISMQGFGVKHDILQWIPGGKLMPFSVSGFFGYTNVDYSQSLGDDKELLLNSTGFTVRALVSKRILFLTPYIGLGVNGGGTNIQLNGTFANPLPGGQDFVDPIDIESDNAGGFVGNVGLRFKFLFVGAVVVDYTFGAYNALTAGLGFSVDF